MESRRSREANIVEAQALAVLGFVIEFALVLAPATLCLVMHDLDVMRAWLDDAVHVRASAALCVAFTCLGLCSALLAAKARLPYDWSSA